MQTELDRLRRATLRHARDRLLGLVDEAVDTLSSVMVDPDPRGRAPSVTAAKTVLAEGRRHDDHVNLEERLTELEAIVEAQREMQRQQRNRWPA